MPEQQSPNGVVQVMRGHGFTGANLAVALVGAEIAAPFIRAPLEAENARLREALESIVSMEQVADSPFHSMQGRTNAWSNLGSKAVCIAREALGDDRA